MVFHVTFTDIFDYSAYFTEISIPAVFHATELGYSMKSA